MAACAYMLAEDLHLLSLLSWTHVQTDEAIDAQMMQASKAETDLAGREEGSAEEGSAGEDDEDENDNSDDPSEVSLVSEDDLPAGSVAIEGPGKRQRTA